MVNNKKQRRVLVMKNKKQQKQDIYALVWQENDLYVAEAIEIEIASQGKTKKEALDNLKEALELLFEDEKVGAEKIGIKKPTIEKVTFSYA
jgi:predicted RNase H-like HicB family nuclease